MPSSLNVIPPAPASKIISFVASSFICLLEAIVKSVPSPSIFSPSLPNVNPTLAGILTSFVAAKSISAVDVIFAITGLVNVLLVKVCVASFKVMLDVFDKSVLAIVIFALPSKLCPAIVLAVSKVVAVAAFPEVSWLPLVLTPGKLMFALPSNDTPPIVLAVARAVAVSALPVTSPVILPVNVPAIAPVPVIVGLVSVLLVKVCVPVNVVTVESIAIEI